MNIQACLEQMKNIQADLLNLIESESDVEENYKKLINTVNDLNIREDVHKLKILLRIILAISNNHHRGTDFFSKIEQIFKDLKNDIQKFFTNTDLFDIFKSNKRILLFLIEEKFISVDKSFVQEIIEDDFIDNQYPEYFSPELKPLQLENWFPKKISLKKAIESEIPEQFYELRKKGENDDLICQIIRKDSVKEFITFINKNNYSLNATIEPSIYETNNFLLNKSDDSSANCTLIQYAAFCGSNQIVKYLHLNGVELNESLWIYAIHGQNVDIIHILEDNHINFENNSSIKCYLESIKCHHNDIASYIVNNYIYNNYQSDEITDQCLINFNFEFIKDINIDENRFVTLCKCDYYSIVSLILKEKNIDINKNKISFQS